MTTKITVIGGSGFIGSRLVTRLLAAGHSVRIIDKSQSETHPDIVTLCDVRDLEGLTSACEGSEVIYNLAAEHRDDVRPLSLYDEVNVGGARNVCEVAERLGVPRMIFSSSVAIYGFSQGKGDESSPKEPFNDYGRTKLEAEAVYEKWLVGGPERSLFVVRPTVVFGEKNRGNVYNLLRQIVSGAFLMIGDGTNRKSMAYVENIAAFLEFGLRSGAGHHVYNYVDKPDYDMNRLVATIRKTVGKRESAGLRLPYWAGYGAGLIADAVAALIRRPLPLSRIRVEKFCASTSFASDKAFGTGFKAPVSLDAALVRTIETEFGRSS